ncbi:MAG: hypothetical protein FWH46_05775 [Methanimicrococcus sp.]|nr:hypothetical protein [Methanimicrococcus sp.]
MISSSLILKKDHDGNNQTSNTIVWIIPLMIYSIKTKTMMGEEMMSSSPIFEKGHRWNNQTSNTIVWLIPLMTHSMKNDDG